MVETYFSGIKTKICEKLQCANTSIKIAVAWFTDTDFVYIINNKLEQGIQVELLINDDKINFDVAPIFELMVKRGADVFLYQPESGIMHNKFCIIDDQTVVTGSYNWTFKASHSNEENINIISYPDKSVFEYIREFDRLKNFCKKSTKIEFSSLKKESSTTTLLTTVPYGTYVSREPKVYRRDPKTGKREQYWKILPTDGSIDGSIQFRYVKVSGFLKTNQECSGCNLLCFDDKGNFKLNPEVKFSCDEDGKVALNE